MPKFNYVAITKNGQRYEGTIEATSRTEVSQILQNKGLTPIKITKRGLLAGIEVLKEINIGGIPLKEKVFFFKQFALMAEAGLPVSRILTILTEQSTYPPIRRILTEVKADVMGGMKLYQAFKKHPQLFDDITLALVKAGEESGKLDYVFKQLARTFNKKHKINSAIRSALAYPIVVIIIIFLVLAFLTLVVLPQMREIFEEFNVQLPLTTRMLFALSDSVRKYPFVYLGLLIGIPVGFWQIKRIPDVKRTLHLILPKIPYYGKIYTRIQLANITSTLGLLFDAGVSIIKAFELAKNTTTNFWYRLEMENIKEYLKKGKRASEYLKDNRFFPPLVRYMFEIGEESGKLGESVRKLAKFYEHEVTYALKNISSIIQPILILLLGIVIGVIVLSIYLPLSQLAQSIG